MSPFNWLIGISGESNSIEGDEIKKAEQLSSALKSYYRY